MPPLFKDNKELLISFLTCLYLCKPSIKIQSKVLVLALKKLSLVAFIVPPDTGSTPIFSEILILKNFECL